MEFSLSPLLGLQAPKHGCGAFQFPHTGKTGVDSVSLHIFYLHSLGGAGMREWREMASLFIFGHACGFMRIHHACHAFGEGRRDKAGRSLNASVTKKNSRTPRISLSAHSWPSLPPERHLH